MAKIKRNCDKCSNRVGLDFCTMRKDMNKAKEKLCDGFKVVPKPIKTVLQTTEIKSKYEANKEVLGDDFYNFLKTGGAWSFNPNNFGKMF